MTINGQIVPVEQIAVGDLLMGSDSQPRRVLELAHGREMIYRITPKNGDSYTCNESHVLSLKVSNKYGGHQKGVSVDMPLREFLALTEYAKQTASNTTKCR